MNLSIPSNGSIPRTPQGFSLARWVLLFSILSTSLGCPGIKNDPGSTVSDFHDAARDGRHNEAKQKVHRPEHYTPSATSEKLPPQGQPHLFWEFKSKQGSLTLEKSGDQAFISKGILNYDSRESPSETLSSFASALRHQRADLLVHYVPSSQGPITVEEMKTFLQQSLFQSLLNKWSGIETSHTPHEILERTQRHAVIGSGTHVFWLVAEPTGWKIKDVQEK